MSAKSKAQEFLTIASQFKLGHLSTESFHPLTKNLSQIVKQDVGEALSLLQTVDLEALEIMRKKSKEIWHMAQEIQSTLKAGNKVFICGCGATGRLSLVLETLYRQKHPNTNSVISFMAGGDYALIKSVESFEDKVSYGERQLTELGFGKDDLLLSPTEGGETPFVIGATNLAAKLSNRFPFFLYCNPDELLMPIERSREVINNEKIHKVNLSVGPMAISGSTRMQASTVLMLAIGVGLLFDHTDEKGFDSFYQNYLTGLTQTDYRLMKGLTTLEARLYKEKKHLNYIADSKIAISILTDTTERSPTFSLPPFGNLMETGWRHSLSYLFIPETKDSESAWQELLSRAPRALEWSELSGRISLDKILGFDISMNGHKVRSSSVPTTDFEVSYSGGEVQFQCMNEKVKFNWGNDSLFVHLMVKMILNAHSTAIMGLLDRYQGNVMTWVRSSNNKLIDRSARYIMRLLDESGKSASFEDVVEKIFEESEDLQDNDPIVLKVLRRY